MQDEVKVSQALPPEVQLIVDEVTAKFRQELQQIMAKDEYTCLITGKAIEPWARQFLARHRHQAERETLARMEWRDIESAPKACHVLAARFNEDCGEWQMQVTLSPPIYPFTHWMPLPPAPTPQEARHD